MNTKEFLKEEINWDEINKWKINGKWHTEWEMSFDPELQAFTVKSGYYFGQEDVDDIYSEMNIATAEKFHELTNHLINYFKSNNSDGDKEDVNNYYKHLFKHLRENGGSRKFKQHKVSDFLDNPETELLGVKIFSNNQNKDEVMKKYDNFLRTGIGFLKCLVSKCDAFLDDDAQNEKNVPEYQKNICGFHIKELNDGTLQPELYWAKERYGDETKYVLCSTLTGTRTYFDFPNDKVFKDFILESTKGLPLEMQKEAQNSFLEQFSLDNFKSNSKELEHMVKTGDPNIAKEKVMKVLDKETGEFLNTFGFDWKKVQESNPDWSKAKCKKYLRKLRG